MDQQKLMKAQFIHSQLEEMQEHLQMLDNEISQMQDYSNNLNFLSDNKEKEVLASIGKGLHLKTNLVSNELYVEVGAGVVVKKTSQEAVKIIDYQLEKLTEARVHIVNKLDIYNKTLNSVMQELQEEQSMKDN